jgi:hypothetical protein
MNIQTPLASAVALWSRTRAELVDVHQLGEDDPALLDTLDGLTDLGDRLAAMLRRARQKEADSKALGEMIAEMKDRKTRLDNSAESLRRASAWAAHEAEIPRLERPDFTATFTMGKRALVGDAPVDQLPPKFVRVKREADKVAIRQALEAGETVPGFNLSNSPKPIVTVRVR